MESANVGAVLAMKNGKLAKYHENTRGHDAQAKLPVVSEKGEILGVLSMADVAEYAKYKGRS